MKFLTLRRAFDVLVLLICMFVMGKYIYVFVNNGGFTPGIVIATIFQIGLFIGVLRVLTSSSPTRRVSDSRRHRISETHQSKTVVSLFNLLVAAEEEDNIIGDLIEEYEQFESKVAAHVWLYKQILKSILPLMYKTIKKRLASRFGKRIP
jgi:hypothetical protein